MHVHIRDAPAWIYEISPCARLDLDQVGNIFNIKASHDRHFDLVLSGVPGKYITRKLKTYGLTKSLNTTHNLFNHEISVWRHVCVILSHMNTEISHPINLLLVSSRSTGCAHTAAQPVSLCTPF